MTARTGYGQEEAAEVLQTQVTYHGVSTTAFIGAERPVDRHQNGLSRSTVSADPLAQSK